MTSANETEKPDPELPAPPHVPETPDERIVLTPEEALDVMGKLLMKKPKIKAKADPTRSEEG